jgi:hypothetical protein
MLSGQLKYYITAVRNIVLMTERQPGTIQKKEEEKGLIHSVA